MDFDQLRSALHAAVPFNATLGIEYVEISPTRAVLRLPDDSRLHNHLGGLHAGAMFSLGEAASGAIVIAAFGAHLATVTPLAASADIRYRRIAHGAVTATATIEEDPQLLLASLADDGKVVFDAAVTLTDENGETTAELTVRWHLRHAR